MSSDYNIIRIEKVVGVSFVTMSVSLQETVVNLAGLLVNLWLSTLVADSP